MQIKVVNFPDPIDAGFVDIELSDLLREIIQSSILYWQGEDDDLEISHAYVCSAQASILRYIDKHQLAIAMPGYESRFKRATRFIELENDENADLAEYQNFGLVDTLGGLCDEVSLWCDANGHEGTDDLALNLIFFCLSATWFEHESDFRFLGQDSEAFQRLLDDVIACHKRVELSKQETA